MAKPPILMLELRNLFASAIAAWRITIWFAWVIIWLQFIFQPYSTTPFCISRIRALSECSVLARCGHGHRWSYHSATGQQKREFVFIARLIFQMTILIFPTCDLCLYLVYFVQTWNGQFYQYAGWGFLVLHWPPSYMVIRIFMEWYPRVMDYLELYELHCR